MVFLLVHVNDIKPTGSNDLKSLKRSQRNIIEKSLEKISNHFSIVEKSFQKTKKGPMRGLARDEGLAESQLHCLVANGITGLAQENVLLVKHKDQNSVCSWGVDGL